MKIYISKTGEATIYGKNVHSVEMYPNGNYIFQIGSHKIPVQYDGKETKADVEFDLRDGSYPVIVYDDHGKKYSAGSCSVRLGAFNFNQNKSQTEYDVLVRLDQLEKDFLDLKRELFEVKEKGLSDALGFITMGGTKQE